MAVNQEMGVERKTDEKEVIVRTDCCEALRNETQALKDCCETLRNEIQTLKDCCETLRNEIQAMKDCYEVFPNENKKLKDCCQVLQSENHKLRERVRQLETPSHTTVETSNIHVNMKWIQDGVTVAGGHGMGYRLNQLWSPHCLYVDDNHQAIYIADSDNHRIMKWNYGASSGQIVAGGNGKGNCTNQLNFPRNVIVDTEADNLIICDWGNRRVVRWPRQDGANGEVIISEIECFGGLAMDDNGHLYVSDFQKNEVKRWKIGEIHGTVVAGGNKDGNGLNQLNAPTYIFVDQDHSIYISDKDNHRVMMWAEGAQEGIIVAGGRGRGNHLTQLTYPYGMTVDQLGTVYVADSWNNRIMRWTQGAEQGSIIIGGNGEGEQPNQLSYPFGLSLDRRGNLYVADYSNHRIIEFQIDSSSSSS